MSRTFVVAPYQVIPAVYAATGVDTSKPGFKARVHQIPVARGPGNANSIENAEIQLAERFIDPATGSPYPNETDLFNADPVTKLFSVPGVINWNSYAPTAAGNFTDTNTPPAPDELVPGIPGTMGAYFHFATEIITMLDLKAGLYRMGVNSDDGFKVTVGPNPRDAFSMRLGSFGDGRSATDTLFDFIVETDGIYPFRLALWQGTGDASVEWFIVDTAGTKVLINDRSQPAAVKAYITEPPAPAFVKLLTPAPGTSNSVVSTMITIVPADASTQVQNNSIQMFVNDLAVTPVITKSGVDTTIVYDPPSDFKHEQVVTVRFGFSDNSTPAKVTTHQYSFQIRPVILVALDDVTMWRYDRSGLDLGTALIADESTTVEPVRTPISRYNDNFEYVTTFYFRTHFNFTGNPSVEMIS